MNCVSALILAWVLSLVGFDVICVTGLNELFGLTITVAGYYVIFFLVGLLFDLTGLARSK